VEAVERRTSIGKGANTIHTVEHLLAAVAAHEINDLTVELSGPEPPILDGSFQPYFEALERAGPVETSGEPLVLTVPAAFTVSEGDSSYVVAPAKELRLTVAIEWPHPLIGHQAGSFTVTPQAFARELAQSYPSVRQLIGAFEQAIDASVRQAQRLTPVAPHAGDMSQVHVHLSYAHPACAVLEYIPWIKDCFTEPAEVVDGNFRLPQLPGAGTTPTRDAWERFRRPAG
jgi:hypothetical protein